MKSLEIIEKELKTLKEGLKDIEDADVSNEFIELLEDITLEINKLNNKFTEIYVDRDDDEELRKKY